MAWKEASCPPVICCSDLLFVQEAKRRLEQETTGKRIFILYAGDSIIANFDTRRIVIQCSLQGKVVGATLG